MLHRRCSLPKWAARPTLLATEFNLHLFRHRFANCLNIVLEFNLRLLLRRDHLFHVLRLLLHFLNPLDELSFKVGPFLDSCLDHGVVLLLLLMDLFQEEYGEVCIVKLLLDHIEVFFRPRIIKVLLHEVIHVGAVTWRPRRRRVHHRHEVRRRPGRPLIPLEAATGVRR